MSYEFEKCLKNRSIVKEEISENMVLAEMEAARYDLKQAKKSFEDGDYKWATIQSYYSMFHTARALIFKKGYRERSHYCLIVAVKELYISTNEISPDFAEKLEEGKSKREQADYGLTYYPTSAEESIKDAEKFIEKCDEIL